MLRIGSEKAKAEAWRPVGSYCNILGTRWWHIGLGRWQWRWWEMVTFWIYFEDRTYRNFWWVAYEVCEREESTILVLLPKYLLTLFSLGLSLRENYLCTPRASGVDMWLSLTSELVMEVVCSFLAESLNATMWDLFYPFPGERQCPGGGCAFSLDPRAKKTWNSPPSADM